jgi:hypothetical protein
MSLEFEKVVPQVQRMGRTLADHSVSTTQQTQLAGEVLMGMDDLEAIWARIMLARQRDAGFRGAAPLYSDSETEDAEPFNRAFPLPECPDLATLLAADGSQVYPDPHGAALYWLINTGVFVYYHGIDHLPEIVTEPQLFFERNEVRESDGRPVSNAAINARRSVFEMKTLARETLHRAESSRPLVSLYDGPLLGMPLGKDITNANDLNFDYHEAMNVLQDVGAVLCGYVDRPSSRFVVYTIHLMTLEDDEIRRNVLQDPFAIGNLTDADLFKVMLGPGDRSAIMVQQSPLNKEYKERYSADHEIAFFYVNVASNYQESYLARVEIPMWVAKNRQMVDMAHALLYAQCQITDRYPYVLTRADEIAVVHAHEKRALDEMIAVELLKNHQSVETSQKLSSKALARFGRQHYDGL